MSLLAALTLVACTPEGADEPGPSGPTLIASSTGRVEVAYPDLAFAPDGTLWVSWAEITDGDVVDIFVARSNDGGATFDTPTLVDDVDQIWLGTVRQPVLAVSEDRIAIAVGGGTYSNGPTILLYVASTSDRVFEGRVLERAVPLIPYAEDRDMTLVDQPEVAFDERGEILVNWKQGTKLESFRMVWARERDGYAVVPLEDGAPGQPCECCPTDFVVYPDGELLLAFRNNDRNLREIFLAQVPPGAAGFEHTSQVSRTGFVLGGCPFDGPVLAQVPAEGVDGGMLVATWADASLGDNYQWMAVSADRGRTWADAFLVYPDNENSLTWPSAATGPDGTLWLSVVEIYHGTLISSTTDLGATFETHEPELPGGPLFFSELAGGPDGVGMIGTTEAGDLWYVPL